MPGFIVLLIVSFYGFILYSCQSNVTYDKPLKPGSGCSIMVPYGFPTYTKSQEGHYYICRDSYSLEYNPKSRTSMWVAEVISAESTVGNPSQKFNYTEDNRVSYITRARATDYNGAGLYPLLLASPSNVSWSVPFMTERHILTNSIPVFPNVYNGVWNELEKSVKNWARLKGKIYVITGPVYQEGKSQGEIGQNKITIPTHIYKVVFDKDKKESVGFVIPNSANVPGAINNYAMSVANVEKVTGINFIPNVNERSHTYLTNDIRWTLPVVGNTLK